MIDEADGASVRNGVAAVTIVAWGLLCAHSMSMPAMTSAGMPRPMAVEPTVSMTAGLNGILNGIPASLPDWALMVAAMMVPVLVGPLQLVRANGLARRRTRSTLLFLLGYAVVWTLAGVVLLFAAAGMLRFGPAVTAAVPVMLAVALVWQCSPVKQLCLNRCHTFHAMPAFGSAADVATLRYGAVHGMWCAGSCWPWMLLPMMAPGGHLGLMAAVSIFVFCERLEEPAPVRWSCRGMRRTMRIVASRAKRSLRMHLVPKSV